MKKHILSIIVTFSFLICMMTISQISVYASEDTKIVDGSYLTMEKSSAGFSSDMSTRGTHLMTGECSITNAGIGRIYAYAGTTANHKVDRVIVFIYVERYLEDVDAWGHVDAWSEEVTDDYYVATSKSLEVEPGYYYRVRAEHIVFVGDESEETASATNGIFIAPASSSTTPST